jgi:CubicO group peptidase (beta-lactamase class C family)
VRNALVFALATALFLVLTDATVAAPLNEAEIKTVNNAAQKQLTRLLNSRKSAGAAFALIDEGRVVLLSANGVRAREAKSSNKSAIAGENSFGLDTPMPVGSITRLITVTLALQLQARQKLDLTQPLQRYLPDLSYQSHLDLSKISPPTMRDVLTNSAGVSRGELRDLFIPIDQKLSAYDFKNVWLARAPGQFSESSFLTDRILGQVLEAVAKQSLETQFQAALAQPLGLSASGFAAPALSAREHDEGKILAPRKTNNVAALGFHSSIRDLAKIIASLDINSAQTLDRNIALTLMQPQTQYLEYDFSAPGTGSGYVFGFSESVRKAVGFVGYLDSALTGHQVSIRLFPKHRLAVVLMSNSSMESDDFSDLLNTLADTALTQKAAIAPRDKQVLRAPPEQLALPKKFLSDALQSAYATPAGLVLPEVGENRFDFNLAGFGLRANRRPDGWYRLRYRLLGMIPLNLSFIENILIAPVSHQQADGSVKHLLLFAAGSDVGVFGSAIAMTSVEGDLGERWLGKYKIANPDVMSDAVKASDIEITRENNVLLLRATFDRFINVDFALPLNVISPETAVLSGFGPGLGEVIRKTPQGDVDFAGYLLRRE